MFDDEPTEPRIIVPPSEPDPLVTALIGAVEKIPERVDRGFDRTVTEIRTQGKRGFVLIAILVVAVLALAGVRVSGEWRGVEAHVTPTAHASESQ